MKTTKLKILLGFIIAIILLLILALFNILSDDTPDTTTSTTLSTTTTTAKSTSTQSTAVTGTTATSQVPITTSTTTAGTPTDHIVDTIGPIPDLTAPSKISPEVTSSQLVVILNKYKLQQGANTLSKIQDFTDGDFEETWKNNNFFLTYSKDGYEIIGVYSVISANNSDYVLVTTSIELLYHNQPEVIKTYKVYLTKSPTTSEWLVSRIQQQSD